MNKNKIYEGNKIIIKNNLLFSQMEKKSFTNYMIYLYLGIKVKEYDILKATKFTTTPSAHLTKIKHFPDPSLYTVSLKTNKFTHPINIVTS